jgi:2,4-dienoyl-CoA reductase (NADPH2)
MVTGGFAPNVEGWLSPFGSRIASRRRPARTRSSPSAVHAEGGKIALQILHAGRYGYTRLGRALALKSPITPFTPRALTERHRAPDPLLRRAACSPARPATTASR